MKQIIGIGIWAILLGLLLMSVLGSCKAHFDPIPCDVKLPDNVRVVFDGNNYHAQVYNGDAGWDFIWERDEPQNAIFPVRKSYYRDKYASNPKPDSCQAKEVCMRYVESHYQPKEPEYKPI